MRLKRPKLYKKVTRIIQQAARLRTQSDGSNAIDAQYQGQRQQDMLANFSATLPDIPGEMLQLVVPASDGASPVGQQSTTATAAARDKRALSTTSVDDQRVEEADCDGEVNVDSFLERQADVIRPASLSLALAPKEDAPTVNAKAQGKAKAKSKTKNSSKRAGATPPGAVSPGGSKPRGAPKRCAVSLLGTGLQMLGDADQSSERFFGDSWKSSTSRNWQNYITDLEEMEAVETDSAQLALAIRLKKQAQAARLVLNKVYAHGVSSSQTLQSYEQQLTYLSLAPAAPNPFPFYLRNMMLEQAISHTQ